MTDRELIGEYVKTGSQAAFGELVRRHGEWVYSCARREVRDEHAAEDVAQAVFILLSQKAKKLGGYERLAGWLFEATRYCSANAIKQQARREKHEREAAMQHAMAASGEAADWEEVWPVLDEAVGKLRSADREAVLLRFYQGMSFGELAAATGTGEEAAKKRVQRALEKLRGVLAKKGVRAGVGALGVVLAEKVTEAAPAGAMDGIAAAVRSGGNGTVAGAIAQGAAKMMAMARIRVLVAVVGVVIAGVVLTPLFAQQAPSLPAPTTKPAVGAQAMPFVAKLPNGLTLEVVGLSYYPSAGRPWWRPDGSPLPDRPYRAMDGVILSGAGQDGREIAVRITNQPANPATANWTTEPAPGASGYGPLVSPTPPDVQARAVCWYWGAPRSTASIVFRIAAGPWIEAAAGQPQMCVSNVFAGSFVFSDACEVDGQTRISVADDRPAEDHRFVAIDNQNREHSPSNHSGGGAGQILLTNLQFADLRRDQLQQVKVQLRPFDTTVRFDGIALSPDQKTQVKVNIQGPAAKETKGQDQFP